MVGGTVVGDVLDAGHASGRGCRSRGRPAVQRRVVDRPPGRGVGRPLVETSQGAELGDRPGVRRHAAPPCIRTWWTQGRLVVVRQPAARANGRPAGGRTAGRASRRCGRRGCRARSSANTSSAATRWARASAGSPTPRSRYSRASSARLRASSISKPRRCGELRWPRRGGPRPCRPGRRGGRRRRARGGRAGSAGGDDLAPLVAGVQVGVSAEPRRPGSGFVREVGDLDADGDVGAHAEHEIARCASTAGRRPVTRPTGRRVDGAARPSARRRATRCTQRLHCCTNSCSMPPPRWSSSLVHVEKAADASSQRPRSSRLPATSG